MRWRLPCARPNWSPRPRPARRWSVSRRTLLAFAARYNDTAVPFRWRCTRADRTRSLRQLPEALGPPAPVPKAA